MPEINISLKLLYDIQNVNFLSKSIKTHYVQIKKDSPSKLKRECKKESFRDAYG